ncbi:NTF2-like N-terminal transpeptidase domain-containing protein [Rhodococcus tukisamuensis]|uniref:NTF2-like N-terminal transpeptidase domain-containing protein n=2 Tax=Rhodococcus tukisamuensis TaxID=168276 RepID=A0A1G6WDV3_9NOCA|nr:NTF2-like N-terminal transpeptidase domain-containing protein [Rhodococcus tukisamuensis]
MHNDRLMRTVRAKLRVWNGIALGAVLLLSVGVVSGVLDRPKTDAETVVATFVDALNSGDVDTAASVTSYPAAAKATMSQMFDALDPEHVEYDVNQVIDLGDGSGMFNAAASWDLGDGRHWDYNVNGWVRQLSIGWRVSWNPQTLAPGLGNGRILRLDRTDAAAPRVFDLVGTPLMTEQRINAVNLDPATITDPVRTTDMLAKAIEPVAPLITAESMRQDLAKANGQQVTAVSLRDADFEILEPDLRAVPGVVIVQRPKLITVDRRISTPLTDSLKNVWQANRDETAGWAVNAVDPDGTVTQLTGYQGPPGPDIRASLDSRLQLAAEDAVVSVGTPAAIVALQPSSGAVIAAAQNNQASDLGPIAFNGLFPSGSAIDLVRTAASAQNSDLEHTARQLGLGLDVDIPGLDQRTAAFPGGGPKLMRAATDGRADDEVRVSPLGMALVASSIARGTPTIPVISSGRPPVANQGAAPLPPAVTEQLRTIMRDTVQRGDASQLKGYGDLIGATGASGQDRWFYGTKGDLAFAVYVQDADGGDQAVKMTDRMFTALAKPPA